MSHLPPVRVVNPPGFSGFPEHDRDDPAFHPLTHGLDPEAYFTHWESDVPLFVEHATGQPKFKVVDGQAEPIDE